MYTEAERPEDELRLITCALREWVAWQEACGAFGLPKSAPSVAALSEVSDPGSLDGPPAFARRTSSSRVITAAESDQTFAPVFELPVTRKLDEPQRTIELCAPQAVLSPQERTERLAALTQEACGCTRCPLHAKRKNVVFGVGPIDVDIMIVGEGPGADEDEQGEPFVGKAGQLLDRMIAAIGFERSKVYIGNVVKCRPENNRVPTDTEIGTCMPYLREQIDLVRPKIMLAMGNIAMIGLFGIGGITRIRGKWKLYNGSIPVMPTFHPAYLLRTESAKRDAWTDLKEAARELKESNRGGAK
ncbi:MAG: uracil-DNA glycosylase [Polyangiaceae bacterium]|nr:uracil-DNA glycosylase [Polyangiaceae bacterium]